MFQKKQIFKLNILKKLLSDENGCVSLVPSTRLLALPPFFLNDMKSGILYLLNCMLKKYDRSLGGIVIGYQNIKVLMDENTGIIPMGTPDIEVNISVEFYVFQPKIGNFLEGIINKKSNNHIGCLVHQYFNATVLKPEDVDFDDWICKDFNVDDKIIFKVKDLDFTSLLPYIEGVVDENFVHKGSYKTKSSDVGVVNKGVHDVTCTEELLTSIRSEDCDGKLLESTKVKNRDEAEFKALDVDKNGVVWQAVPQTNTKREDKKKRENGNENQKGQSSNKQDLTANCDGDVGVKSNKSFGEKKKKKKAKGDDVFENFNSMDHAVKENDDKVDLGEDCFPLEKYVRLENENSNDFIVSVKSKNKKKAKKTKVNESLNKTFECVSSKGEDNVFCSTQLEPKSNSKMLISFCSPIPRGMPFGAVDKKSLSDSSATQDSQSITAGAEKEKKKKHKKRSREEEDEVESVPKKIKISSAFPETGHSDTKMSETEKLMKELCKEQVNRVMGGDSNRSGKVNSKGMKNRKKVLKQQRKDAFSEGLVGRASEVDGVEETSEEQSTFYEFHRQDLSGKKELSGFGNDSAGEKSKEDTRNKSLKAKKKSEGQPSDKGTGGEKKKAAEKLTDKESVKEEQKPKTAEAKRTVSREGTNDSLYKKSLQEAENFVDLEQFKPSTSKEPGKSRSKKDSELSDFSTGSSKRKHSRKKSKHKEKLKDRIKAHDEYKNGSMYDMADSPEKLHPDKSLFTDSEQSHNSPAKKRKEINGVEDIFEEKSKVKIKSNIFCNQEAARMISKSGREGSKDSNKNDKVEKKSKRKHQSPGRPKESLYEKLLEQAKRLIDIKGESTLAKKGT